MIASVQRAAGLLMLAAVTLCLFPSCSGTARLKREAAIIADSVQAPENGASARDLQAVCWELSQARLRYVFGSSDPARGGMDCSGTVQHVLGRLGYRHVPRQSNHQYYWLTRHGWFKHSRRLDQGVLARLRPGDLLFWSGTYRTGKRWPKISHVMIYAGKDPATGRHHMFGGRSAGRRGVHGAEIDYFPLQAMESEGRSGRFAGWGRPPGLRKK